MLGGATLDDKGRMVVYRLGSGALAAWKSEARRSTNMQNRGYPLAVQRTVGLVDCLKSRTGKIKRAG